MYYDAPETVLHPTGATQKTILEQWYQQLRLTVPGPIHKENIFFFYFAVALIQSLRKSLGSSLTDTSNKNQPESYTRLLLRSHKGKGPLVAWLCWSHQCLIGLHPVPRDK